MRQPFGKSSGHHRPITDIWQIAGGTARRLAKIGVYDLYGITRIPEATLYRLFGKNAAALIDHPWGREPCTLSDIRTYSPRSRSISAGQILFENYTAEAPASSSMKWQRH